MWKQDMAMQAAHEEQLRTMEMSLLGELWPDDSISLKMVISKVWEEKNQLF